ncbi:MAG: penicillin-binding transpeptidase domain-containing protein [Clostridia bacterium]
MTENYTALSIKKRLLATIVAVTFFLFLLLCRLCYLQVFASASLQARALSQWMRDLPITALRGGIYDRNGIALAESYTTYDIYVRPSSVKEVNKVTYALSSALGLDISDVASKVSNKLYSEVLIKKSVEKNTAMKLIAGNNEGIMLSENNARKYSYGDFLTQVIGFNNADGNGQTGLEAFYNKYLKGVNGKKLDPSNIKGQKIDGSVSYYLPSIEGLDINLTIDAEIQKYTEKVMEEACASYNPKSATAIVMNPQSGEILSMTTKPSFDLNNVPRDDVPSLMNLSSNYSVSSAYEPGSTFKVIIGAIALQEGVTSLNDYFYCSGFRIISGVKVNCHRHSGHGSQSLEKIYCNSCNCGFMELATRIGIDKLYKYFEKLKIGELLGIDVGGENRGVLMNKGSVQPFDLARIGFGQAIAITPLQLINSVACAINGGKLVQPHIVKRISNNDGNIVFEKNVENLGQVFSNNVSASIRKMLKAVVDSGGGKHAKVDGYSIGGKTGTAQKYENGEIAQGKYVASFIGFYPTDVPEYLVLVLLDEPQGSYYGGVVAAPLASQIFQYIFKYKEKEKNENSVIAEKNIVMPNVIGMTFTEACSTLASLGLYYLVEGTGGVVTTQMQTAGTLLAVGDVALIVMSENDPS